jgi:hypothetical protein
MTIQTVELAGRRFVIISEEDFQRLWKSAGSGGLPRPEGPPRRGQFAAVKPLKVSGIPASELLIQDRR